MVLHFLQPHILRGINGRTAQLLVLPQRTNDLSQSAAVIHFLLLSIRKLYGSVKQALPAGQRKSRSTAQRASYFWMNFNGVECENEGFRSHEECRIERGFTATFPTLGCTRISGSSVQADSARQLVLDGGSLLPAGVRGSSLLLSAS